MRQYRIKEEIRRKGSTFTPQYKDDDCTGYYNPDDPEAVHGYTEWNTFLCRDNTYDLQGLIIFKTDNIQDALNKIDEDKNPREKIINVVYHKID